MNKLGKALRAEGIGCYTNRAKYLIDLADSNIDLKECTIEDLEDIKGIGPKTARFIILFSREGENCAVLDVHILRWLKGLGFNVPHDTPSSSKKYREIEKIFINEYKKHVSSKEISLASFDYMIWEQMSGRKNI